MTDMAAAFAVFDGAHPDVWGHFERIALDMWRRGRTHYSARTILHVIRHHVDTTAHHTEAEFRLNDHWSPFYARRFMARYPECGPFFELRPAIADTKERTCA